MRIFLVVLMTMAGAGTALAFDDAADDFIGFWRNIERTSQGVTAIEIRPDQGNRVRVRVLGICGARECEFGQSIGQIFFNRSERAAEQDTAAILTRFTRDDISGNVLIRLNRRGDIVSHAMLTFRERGQAIYSVERFQRSERSFVRDGDPDVGSRFRRH
jgi:hypothetical protein